MAKKKSATPLSPEAIAALEGATFCGNAFRLSDGDLRCYPEIKALCAALGGRWVSRSGQHEFPDGADAQSLVLGACMAGAIPPSNPHDYFGTPAEVVAEMLGGFDFVSRLWARRTAAQFAERGLVFREPSAGTGALAAAMAEMMETGDTLELCEINPLSAAILRRRFPQATVTEGDFLQQEYGAADIILMNPPFAGKVYQEHVQRAFRQLRPFGILVAIVPETFIDHASFLDFVNMHGEFAGLGKSRFAGTNVGTAIIWLENDPDCEWRERPCEGFATYHAMTAAHSAQTDRELLERLERTCSLAEATDVLRGYCREISRHGQFQRMDEAIARDVIEYLVTTEVMPDLIRLIEKGTRATPDDAPGDEFDAEAHMTFGAQQELQLV